jgi:hypothetical protein
MEIKRAISWLSHASTHQRLMLFTNPASDVDEYVEQLHHVVIGELHKAARGQFPYLFKQASITPFLKKRGIDSPSFSNYCPISDLNTISKLLKRLILSRFQAYVLTSSNYNKNQSAYRRHHST